jgi:hypothetical protein
MKSFQEWSATNSYKGDNGLGNRLSIWENGWCFDNRNELVNLEALEKLESEGLKVYPSPKP